MDYELAKRLDEAGWPQHSSEKYYAVYHLGGIGAQPVMESTLDQTACGDFRCDAPNASELLKACEEEQEVELSSNYISNPDGGKGDKWFAGRYNFHNGYWVEVYAGNTPEEALAYYWLSFNTKP